MPSDVQDPPATRTEWPGLSGLADGPPIHDGWWSPPTAPGGWSPPPPLPPGPGAFGPGGAGGPGSRKRSSGGAAAAIAVFVVAMLVAMVAVGGAGYLISSPSGKRTAAESATRSTLPGPASGQGSPSSPSTIPGAPGTGGQPPSTSSSGAPDWDKVATTVNPGIVDIVSRMDGGIGAGTGMVLTADGAILTNNHVVDGAENITVTLVDSGDSYHAYVVGTDPNNDVAVLRLEGASALTPIPIGDSDAVKTGDPVAAMGNAGGRGGAPVVATGKVVALHRTITASESDGSNAHRLTDTIQVDANVQSGDSGGPLVDANAKVVGMNSAASVGGRRQRTAAHEGYAIPINRALEIAEGLENGSGGSSGGGSSPSTTQPSSRGYLGVQSQDGSQGASVVVVQPNSPAAKAGLKNGDEIVGFDGDAITSADDLRTAIQQHEPGDQVQITWSTAAGRQQQATVTLGTR